MSFPYLTVLLTGILQSSLLACLPVLIDLTPLDAGEWSWLLGGSMLGFMLMAPLWGRLTDRISPARSLRLSLSGICLAQALLLIALTAALLFASTSALVIGLLIISRGVYTLFAPGLFGAAQAWISGSAESLRTGLARLNGINQLGRLLGPVLVASVAWQHPLWSQLLLLPALLALLLWGRCQPPNHPATPGSAIKSSPIQPEAEFTLVSLLPELLVAAALTTLVGIIQFVLGPYLQSLLSLSPVQATAMLGQLLAAIALIMFLTGWVLIPRLRALPRVYTLLMPGLLGGGALLIAEATALPQLSFGLGLFAAGIAFCTPWYGEQLRRRWPRHPGRIGGLLTTAHTFGYGSGTLAGGWLLSHQPDAPLQPLLPATLVLMAAILILLWRRRESSA